ncbi:hypothetical protein Pcinc_041010 [Petrolisthes cinctipes]|uniref:Uncharacterized protein n=1 Tax=Petrolisthes cinctipes TaxID=88211 RepID=A0AAE1EI71_PETCI|nr:hypothetical protein Pcinc_041010 [Petrolisthes cinctipes]
MMGVENEENWSRWGRLGRETETCGEMEEEVRRVWPEERRGVRLSGFKLGTAKTTTSPSPPRCYGMVRVDRYFEGADASCRAQPELIPPTAKMLK